mmetsp:Transcript_37431/g.51407  ORF Transcript_37431/g.51407 Transcript_37431/m.51407 type:complete len:156 (+) Transcript_37431:2-469(+)
MKDMHAKLLAMSALDEAATAHEEVNDAPQACIPCCIPFSCGLKGDSSYCVQVNRHMTGSVLDLRADLDLLPLPLNVPTTLRMILDAPSHDIFRCPRGHVLAERRKDNMCDVSVAFIPCEGCRQILNGHSYEGKVLWCEICFGGSSCEACARAHLR